MAFVTCAPTTWIRHAVGGEAAILSQDYFATGQGELSSPLAPGAVQCDPGEPVKPVC